MTGLHAGTPVADVFAIIARENSECDSTSHVPQLSHLYVSPRRHPRLSGRSQLGRGEQTGRSMCHPRCHRPPQPRHRVGDLRRHSGIFTGPALEPTTPHPTLTNIRFFQQVFHCLLGAFHTAHALILQEGGALTTLCVAFVAPMKNSRGSALCVCNVGDSLAFVFNRAYGVREVTLASHDVSQMRDMRDAGGALGPVDGRNPQLHNLTCSMTFVDEGRQCHRVLYAYAQ